MSKHSSVLIPLALVALAFVLSACGGSILAPTATPSPQAPPTAAALGATQAPSNL